MTNQNNQLNGVDAMDPLAILQDLLKGIGNQLPADASSELALRRKAAELKLSKNVTRNIDRAIVFVRTTNIINNMGELNELKNYFLFALLSYTSYWGGVKKDDMQKRTYGSIIYEDLLKVVDANSIVAQEFCKAADWLYSFYTLKPEGEEGKIVIKDPKSDVKVSLYRTGICISIEHGKTLMPTNSKQGFHFRNKISVIYNGEVFNKHLTTVLRNVKIHKEFVIKSNIPFAKDITTYRKDQLTFRRADILGLLLILKANRIDISELFEAQQEGNTKSLVLGRKDDGQLYRMYVPGYTFPEVYGNHGVTSLTEARQGIVAPKTAIARLVEFTTDRGVDYALTREAVNKTINRVDKLHDKDGWTTKPIKFIIVDDSRHDLDLNWKLVTGEAKMPTSFSLKYGVCRIVTDMDFGGFKAATGSMLDLDIELNDLDYGVIAASAVKGGILAAIGLAHNNPDFIPNLCGLVESSTNSSLILSAIVDTYNKELKTYVIGGVEVKGIEVEIPVTITNAYTVESVMLNPDFETEVDPLADSIPDLDKVQKNLDNLESELLTGKRAINGLRDKVMNRVITEDDFTVGQWLVEGLDSGYLKRKPAITRILSSELQSIANWHGDVIAKNYLRGLLESQAKEGFSASKVYATQLIADDIEPERIVEAWKIAEILHSSTVEGFAVVAGSPSYAHPILRKIVNMFKVENDFGWVGVRYPNGAIVNVPCGFIFENDFEEQDPTNFVIAKGLLNDLLENIKSIMIPQTEGEIFEDTVKDKLLAAAVQKPLLGKNFGYQYTKGMYGVMLSLIGNYSEDELALTDRDHIHKSDSLYVKMNGSKAPQLFRDSSAGYKVFRKTFGDDVLDRIFACAIFITPKATMIIQNDHDGDLLRISKDKYNLPSFVGPANSFNGKFFTDFIAGELAGNKLSIKPAGNVTMRQFHTEIFNAVEAKGKVGQYTANKCFYEAALANVDRFIGTNGIEYTLSGYDSYVIAGILSQLIQTEAMNNIKLEGASVFITDLLLYWKLNSIKGYNGKSKEELTEEVLKKATELLNSLVAEFEMNIVKADVTKYVQAMYYAATNFNRDNMPAYFLMNARTIEERNVADIMSAAKDPDYEYKGNCNFAGSFDRIVNGVDTKSMYHHIIVETVKTILV